MSAITFDSLTTARLLRDKGVPQEQADAIADAIRISKDTDFSHLATKEELTSFKSELKADLRGLEAEMKNTELRLEAKVAEAKAELIKWVVGMGVAQMAMFLTIIKLH